VTSRGPPSARKLKRTSGREPKSTAKNGCATGRRPLRLLTALNFGAVMARKFGNGCYLHNGTREEATDFLEQAVGKAAFRNVAVRAVAATFFFEGGALDFGIDDDAQLWVGTAKLLGCLQAVEARHTEVKKREIGPVHISADIGCHSFATFAPFSLGNSILGYGMSLASAAAVGPNMKKRPIAIMGDGGFWHNGVITGVASNLFNKGDGVLLVMQNGYTSATGQQYMPSSAGRGGGDRCGVPFLQLRYEVALAQRQGPRPPAAATRARDGRNLGCRSLAKFLASRAKATPSREQMDE